MGPMNDQTVPEVMGNQHLQEQEKHLYMYMPP